MHGGGGGAIRGEASRKPLGGFTGEMKSWDTLRKGNFIEREQTPQILIFTFSQSVCELLFQFTSPVFHQTYFTATFE